MECRTVLCLRGVSWFRVKRRRKRKKKRKRKWGQRIGNKRLNNSRKDKHRGKIERGTNDRLAFRKSNKAGAERGKWEATKIGYSHVLHLRGVASDCRTFGTCPADTAQVKGRARRVIPSNREGTLSRRTPPRKHTGSSAGSGTRRRRKKWVCWVEKKEERTHSARNVPRRRSRTF